MQADQTGSQTARWSLERCVLLVSGCRRAPSPAPVWAPWLQDCRSLVIGAHPEAEADSSDPGSVRPEDFGQLRQCPAMPELAAMSSALSPTPRDARRPHRPEDSEVCLPQLLHANAAERGLEAPPHALPDFRPQCPLCPARVLPRSPGELPPVRFLARSVTVRWPSAAEPPAARPDGLLQGPFPSCRIPRSAWRSRTVPAAEPAALWRARAAATFHPLIPAGARFRGDSPHPMNWRHQGYLQTDGPKDQNPRHRETPCWDRRLLSHRQSRPRARLRLGSHHPSRKQCETGRAPRPERRCPQADRYRAPRFQWKTASLRRHPSYRATGGEGESRRPPAKGFRRFPERS